MPHKHHDETPLEMPPAAAQREIPEKIFEMPPIPADITEPGNRIERQFLDVINAALHETPPMTFANLLGGQCAAMLTLLDAVGDNRLPKSVKRLRLCLQEVIKDAVTYTVSRTMKEMIEEMVNDGTV